MATGETGFEDVTYDLISVQYHALKAGHDYGQYVRDAENAGLNDIAQFFRDTMKDDWDVTYVPKINGVRKTGMGSIAMAATPAGSTR